MNNLRLYKKNNLYYIIFLVGVLGHGIGQYSSVPKRIESLGSNIDSKAVVLIAAGSKHVLSLSTSNNSKSAINFRYLIDNVSTYPDVEIFADDITAASGSSTTQRKSIRCHRFLLACRSRYFSGYLKAASEYTDNCGYEDDNRIISQIDLTGLPGASMATIVGLIDYFYLDKLNVPAHRMNAMIELADYLCLQQLKEKILTRNSTASDSNRSYSRSYRAFTSLKPPDYDLIKTSSIIETTQSIFSMNMKNALTDSSYADVKFTVQDRSNSNTNANKNNHAIELFSHKAILCQCEYFAVLFGSSFRETRDSASSPILSLTLDGLQDEGIDISTFESLLEYAYTGELNYEKLSSEGCLDLNQVISLLIASNRLGFSRLAVRCEREIIENLKNSSVESIQNCIVFARIYDFIRLERSCLETLRLMDIKVAEKI